LEYEDGWLLLRRLIFPPAAQSRFKDFWGPRHKP